MLHLLLHLWCVTYHTVVEFSALHATLPFASLE